MNPLFLCLFTLIEKLHTVLQSDPQLGSIFSQNSVETTDDTDLTSWPKLGSVTGQSPTSWSRGHPLACHIQVDYQSSVYVKVCWEVRQVLDFLSPSAHASGAHTWNTTHALNLECKRKTYLKIPEKLPQQHFEDKMTIKAVITFREPLTKCQTITFTMNISGSAMTTHQLQKFPTVGVENYLTISPKEKQYKKDFFFGRAGGLLMEALQDSPWCSLRR